MSRLVLLPGTGADRRLLEPQRAAFPDLEVPQWIDPNPSESLPDYAKRLAATIGDVDVIGGISLGGMIALEASRHIQVREVILISSCRSCRSIPLPARLLAELQKAVPEKSRDMFPMLTWPLFGELTDAQKRLVLEMARDTDFGFIRWAVTAMKDWSFEGEPPVPVRHIHGDRDRLIPRRLVRPDRVVHGAGHLMNLTHAEEVNAFIGSHGFASPTSDASA